MLSSLDINLGIHFSTCITDQKYNQYECYAKEFKRRIDVELKCLFPFQIYNKLENEKGICRNMTDMAGKIVVKLEFPLSY